MAKSTQAAARADNTTIAATIVAGSPQSQLAALTGVVATINPQGDTALFIRADVQGKEHAQTFRLHMISTAVLEVLKGNSRNYKEAVALVAQLGKGKKARAYAAGFAALEGIGKLGATGAIEGSKRADGSAEPARTGKWTDDVNAGLRTIADTLTAAYVAQFASAHATVMAEKPAPKVKKEAAPAPAPVAAEAAPAPAPAAAEAAPVDTVVIQTEETESLDVGDAIASVIAAIKQGLVEQSEVAALYEALAMLAPITTPEAGTLAHLMTTTPAQQPALQH